MSYNSLIATAVLDMPLQDDAASTVVVNNAGTDGTLVGGDNTADLSTTGPTTWLPKALQFDGTADYATTPNLAADIGDEATFFAWVKRDAATPSTLATAGFVSMGDTGGSSHYPFSDGLAYSSIWRVNRVNSIALGSTDRAAWHSFAVTSTPGADGYKIWQNGVAIYTGTGQSPLSLSGPWLLGSSQTGQLYPGALSGVLAIASVADIPELHAGPEPTYTSGATLASNGAYDVGTWDAQSNGTATYEWVVVEADGTVVDSGTGATGTADLGATTGLLTLLVRASNDGGYDVGDFATRTSGYGSAGDGYYEVATVTIPLAPRAIYYQRLLRC